MVLHLSSHNENKNLRRPEEIIANGHEPVSEVTLEVNCPPSVGKTHWATALGVACAELGHRITFTTAINVPRKLAVALAENKLHREMKNLTRPKLLVIDEVGFLTPDPTQASLLF